LDEKNQIKRERWKLLVRLQRLLDGPLSFLGFVWLVLIIIDLTRGLSPGMQKINFAIWILFVIDLVISFILAPSKISFLKKNILVILSLAVPALRIFRSLRIFHLLRSLRLVRVLGSVNRSIKSLSVALTRRGFGYMFALMILVTLGGGAGIFAFEKGEPGGLKNYGDAIWWTAMILITLGSEYWPKTPEGRILCFLIALFGFAVLGYITATLATFFIDKDSKKKAEAGRTEDFTTLRREMEDLKQILNDLRDKK
jgi:voltage-gated potassium channel